MDHKTLTIASILTIALILLLGANIGLVASVSGKQPADPTNFGPNCVGCISTQNLANGAVTHSKIALHSVDQTQLAFAIHNGTNGAQGPTGPVGQTGATGPAGPQGQGIQFGHLIVIVHVTGDQNGRTGGATASSFTEHITGNNQSPDTFQGAESPGTNVTLGFGSYQVTEDQNQYTNPSNGPLYNTIFSTDCSGVIHPSETKTCTVTHNFLQ